MAVRMKKTIVAKSKKANVSIKLLNLRVKSFFLYIPINAMLLAKPIIVNVKNRTLPIICTVSIPLGTVSSSEVVRFENSLVLFMISSVLRGSGFYRKTDSSSQLVIELVISFAEF